MLSRRQWKFLFFATLPVVFSGLYLFCSDVAKKYNALNDSYIIEVSENIQYLEKNRKLEEEVRNLKLEIQELKEVK